LAAAHILVSLTKGKSNEQIGVDFDNNLEFVSVWIDYMVGVKWMDKDTDGKWMTTCNGKRWIEKCYNAMRCNVCGYIVHNILHIEPY
jgi:hypothetical protein